VSAGAWEERREKTFRLLAEAGVSESRLRAEHAVAQVFKLLVVVGVACIVAGFLWRSPLIWIGVVLSIGSIVAVIAMGAYRLRSIEKVRWREGTITFRTIEPGHVHEDGQDVVCEVEVSPPPYVLRMATTVGPMDVQRLVVGATMRCRIDRTGLPIVLRAYPYAEPGAELPAGRELGFRKA
jgi:hypothetical protein